MTTRQDSESPVLPSSKPPTVLIVDDELTGRMAARKLVMRNPHIDEPIEFIEASSLQDALSLLAQLPIEVVLLDKNVGPDPADVSQNGIESIPEMLRLRPALRILLLTASSQSEDITRAMKLGAFDYMIKTSAKESRQKKVADAIENSRIAFRKLAITRLNDPYPSETEVNLGGNSVLWNKSVSRAKQFAPNQLPVLITGPTGCGKTELARLIHCENYRRDPNEAKTFVDLNIAALSAEIAERELFGNERGAYTGADQRRPGYFELANHGTLFLDEIGDADLDLQKKLLKVIEDGKFYRLGGKEVFHSKFKLICATHRDLKKMVAEGKFREDLYMRISTLTLSVPPLSQRKADIPEMVAAMLPRICKLARVDVSVKELPDDFIRYLTENDFQGNARGIWQQISLLVVLAPSDRSGGKVFSNWLRLLELDERESSDTPLRSSLTLNDVLKTPLDFFRSDFPGVSEVVSTFEDRIYAEARRQYKSNNAIARALKVSNSTASTNLKRIEGAINS
jgi:DNA-binding NtrC family response regulator